MAHPQRVDLNEKRQPVRAPKGGGYGARKAIEDAQHVAPLPAGTEAVGAPAATPADPPSYVGPALPPLHAPTQRPDEFVTAGLGSGPGPGPEVLGLPQAGDEQLARLAQYLPQLEIMVSAPHSSAEDRNFVRLVRASIPTGA